jgi:hypothetical protein
VRRSVSGAHYDDIIIVRFLELNPTLPADSTFVDGARPGDDQLRAFPAYDAVGFEALPLPGGGGDDNKAKADALAEAAKALKPPSLSPGDWFKYLANVARVSPVPDGMKFGEVRAKRSRGTASRVARVVLRWGAVSTRLARRAPHTPTTHPLKTTTTTTTTKTATPTQKRRGSRSPIPDLNILAPPVSSSGVECGWGGRCPRVIQVPTGVLRLGGTFVVRDDRVVYAYADPLPGAHPNVDEVVAKALGSAAPSSQ